jgi:hypothetical protein
MTTFVTFLKTTLAAVLLLVCVVWLLRLCLPKRYRHRVDAVLASLKYAAFFLPRHWRASRMAEQVVETAKSKDGQWKGNVFTPKAFDQSGKPRKPH